MGTCGKTPRVDTASSSFEVETADQSSELNVRYSQAIYVFARGCHN